jgi:hypothetical protein
MAGLLSSCRSATLRLGVFALNLFAPIVHRKMKTGKECSSAECARHRSRHHCVTARRVASPRQGFEWGARPSRLPFSASRRKPFNKLICPTMIRARRPNPRAGRARSPPNRPSQNENRKRAVQVRNGERGVRSAPQCSGTRVSPVCFSKVVAVTKTHRRDACALWLR